MKHSFVKLYLLIFTLLLTSCNGGSNNNAASSPTPTPTINPALAPIIFNYQKSAKAGDLIYLQGYNLSNAQVILDGYGDIPILNSYESSEITVRLPESITGAIKIYLKNTFGNSPIFYLNQAQPYNMDTTIITPGAPFRILGKNLFFDGYTPTVTIGGKSAQLNLSQSTETMLVGTAPNDIISGKTSVSVNNGNGSGYKAMLQPITIIHGSAADPFNLNVGWASGFESIAKIIIDPTTDPNVNPHMVADGITDNTQALLAAINYAHSIGGGTIYIPAGTYLIAEGSIPMESNVVLKGAGKNSTILNYTGAHPIYSLNNDLVGLTNLTLSTTISPNALIWDNNTRSFFKNIAISFNISTTIFSQSNVNFAIESSDFSQSGLGVNGQGLQWLANCSGLLVTGNTYQFLSGGAFSIDGSQNAYIANNRIIRNGAAQDEDPAITLTHGITMNFLKRATINLNSFEVINGPITNYTRNDGEALLSEGGGAGRTESMGMVTSATALSLTDVNNNIIFSNVMGLKDYSVIIISGTGTGQKRDIIAYSNHTMTIDRPWDVIPDTSSKYITTVMSMEDVIISNNRFNQWPRGTWIYIANSDSIDIFNNSYIEGGGILLRAETSDIVHDILFNINVIGNQIVNTTRIWSSYFILSYVDDQQQSPDGLGALGVIFKNNQLQANNPNFIAPGEDIVEYEGYGNFMFVYMAPIPYIKPSMGGIIGTIFQGNTCRYCEIAFHTGTDVFASNYVNTLMINSDQLLANSYIAIGGSVSESNYIYPK